MKHEKRWAALIITVALLFALAGAALGIWLVVSGVQGARDDGASNWEVFKIVFGVLWLLSGTFGGTRRD